MYLNKRKDTLLKEKDCSYQIKDNKHSTVISMAKSAKKEVVSRNKFCLEKGKIFICKTVRHQGSIVF